MVIVLAGVAIFGYLAVRVMDSIAHGIIGGAWKEKKRRRVVDQLSHHIIACGSGRVGRRAVEEFRHAIVREIRKLERLFESREALAT